MRCAGPRIFAVFFGLISCVLLPASAQVIIPDQPQATSLSGNPWGIRAEWRIGGEGTWDYLAVDPIAAQLFIAHGPQMQIVDLHSGERTASVTGIGEARDVVLDPVGAYAFISDARAAQVRVLDRRTLEMVASVPTGPTPRALVYEPQTQLLFAICAAPVVATPETAPLQNSNDHPRKSIQRPPVRSTVTVIDAHSWKLLGDFQVSGRLGFGQADSRGNVFMTVEDRKTIIRFDAAIVARQLRTGAPATTATSAPQSSANASSSTRQDVHGTAWDPLMRRFLLPNECTDPAALAIDNQHLRLFVGCENGHLNVLDSESGSLIASLSIGLDPGTVLYDSGRQLIFTANGGGDGSMTIIHQDVNDNYEVVQQLITRPRARTMAENPAAGRLYLVTDIYGFDLSGQNGGQGGIGTLKTRPMPGSFEVIEVGPVGAP